MENKYVLKMEGITKEYFGNKVLKGVELKVRPGEIHALMGENGAGKSTLMNILFGMPVIHSTGGFGGTIEFNGEPVKIENPHKAMELGIGMVHQEFMLIPGFTVAENVKLGREISTQTVASSIFGKSLERLDKPGVEPFFGKEDLAISINKKGKAQKVVKNIRILNCSVVCHRILLNTLSKMVMSHILLSKLMVYGRWRAMR